MTDSARQALIGLRDPHSLQWYVVPLLALLFYVYVSELRGARKTGNWDPFIAGAAVFFADLVNESINGWILAISGYSALWLAPGPSAMRVMVGLNLEIMFMFGIAGLIFYKSLDEDPAAKVLGLPNRWFWALFYSVVSVVTEFVLNRGNVLVWDWRWWNGNVVGLSLIVVFGYLWLYGAAKFAIERPTLRGKVMVPAALAGVAALLNLVGQGLLGFVY